MSTLNWPIFESVTKPVVSDIGHGKNIGQFSMAKQLLCYSTKSVSLIRCNVFIHPLISYAPNVMVNQIAVPAMVTDC